MGLLPQPAGQMPQGRDQANQVSSFGIETGAQILRMKRSPAIPLVPCSPGPSFPALECVKFPDSGPSLRDLAQELAFRASTAVPKHHSLFRLHAGMHVVPNLHIRE